MAGYTKTPLLKKLGIKEDSTIYIYNPPTEYYSWISPLPPTVIVKIKAVGQMDFIHVFVKDQHEFRREFLTGQKHLKPDGLLWVSWPKKSSKVPTDLDENVIRNFGLQQGLVDVKVCAVDAVWSALKFVVRVKNR